MVMTRSCPILVNRPFHDLHTSGEGVNILILLHGLSSWLGHCAHARRWAAEVLWLKGQRDV